MRKLLLFLFFLVFSFSLVITPVFAAQNQNVTLGKDQMNNGDYFASGGNVTVLGTVNGDSYTAGGTVTIEGNVKGDVIAGGGTVTVNGSAQNVRVAGGTVTINGTVAKNITVMGGTVNIEPNAKIRGSIVATGGTINILSPVGKGATIAGGNVTINNSINGNVYATAGQLNLDSQAKINGDLYYTSQQKANLAQGATITGKTEQKIPQQNRQEMQQKAAAGIATIWFVLALANFISMLIIGLLLIAFVPNYVKKVSDSIMEKPWWSLLVSIITVIVTPIILAILFMTIIGIPLAILLLLIYLVVLYFAKIFAIYLIGERIGGRINPKMHMAWLFVIGLIIYQILVLIPVIGWLVDMLAILFGLGGYLIQEKYLYQALRRNKTL